MEKTTRSASYLAFQSGRFYWWTCLGESSLGACADRENWKPGASTQDGRTEGRKKGRTGDAGRKHLFGIVGKFAIEGNPGISEGTPVQFLLASIENHVMTSHIYFQEACAAFDPKWEHHRQSYTREKRVFLFTSFQEVCIYVCIQDRNIRRTWCLETMHKAKAN